jgi:hypothetical protein
MDDQQAIERYRYMLRTAPPDDIERAHEQAFSSLTPEQRASVLAELSKDAPASEVPSSDDPRSLARMATRAEMREPGSIERRFGQSQTPGLGGMFMSTLAGAFIGSAIGNAFFGDEPGAEGGSADTGEASPEGEAEGDVGDAGGDFGDFGGGDFGGGDF